MTTFDLAITYLKKIDFNNFSESEEGLSIKKPSRALKNELDKTFVAFENDRTNSRSGQHYSKICFMTATSHFLQKRINPHDKSLFEVACAIIETKKQILDNPQIAYTSYGFPKEIWDDWVKYSDTLNSEELVHAIQTPDEFLLIAWYYTIYPNRA